MQGFRRPRHLGVVLAAAFLVASVFPLGASAALGAPTPTSPSSGATVNANPTLIWTALSGAVRYRVELATTAAFGGTTIYTATTVNRYATPTVELPLGLLYWRVAGYDAASVLGAYSAAQTFTKNWTGAPIPSAPANAATLTFPTSPALFTWGALPGASSYELEIDDAADFIGATKYTTKNTSFALTEPQTVGQTFYWHVRGVATSTSGTISSAWSSTRHYGVAWASTPTLLAPANTNLSSITDVVFHWSPVLGAATYELQVSPNGDFQNNTIVDVTVKGTYWQPVNTLNNASYFWRVRAKDAAGNNGSWSATWTFTRAWTPRPTLVAPSDQDFAVEVPTFEWTPIARAAYYQLQVGTDPNFSSSASYRDCLTNHTKITPYLKVTGPTAGCTFPLVPGTLYYWHVRGIDPATGVLGLWSNVGTGAGDLFSFIYKPTSVNQTAPANGATVNGAPILSWSPVDLLDGIVSYQVTIKKSDKSTTAATATTYATSYTPTSRLTPADGPFYWYVQARDREGRLSLIPNSSLWPSFTLAAPSPTYATPDPTAPADAAASVRMPSLQWQPVTGADHYEVWYGVAGSGVEQRLGSANLPYAAYTYPTAILPIGSYFWYVKAFNASSVLISESSAAQRTFTISQVTTLGTTDYLAPARCDLNVGCTPETDTPSLVWNPKPSAGFYRVWLALDPNFTNVVRTYETTYTHLRPSESLPDNQAGQAYYWFVQPCKNPTNCGRFDAGVWANASAFQKRSAAVEQMTPAASATVANEVKFTWRDYLATYGDLTPVGSQEARSYRIQVSTVADFATLIDDRTVDQLTYAPFDRTYPEGPLYWRVQAYDGSNQALTASAGRLVTKASPAVGLSSPVNGATVTGVPFLSWTPQVYAGRYEVQLARNGDTLFSAGNLVFTSQTKMSAFSYIQPLPAGLFAWRVRRLDADGRYGPWSAARTFTLKPSSPSLTAPATGSSVKPTSLLFQWTGVAGAVKYRWERSAGSSFATIAATQDTVMTAWAPLTAIPDGTWYWRVKVLDAGGNVLATSATASIIVDTVAPTVVSVAPTSSASITGSFSATFSESVKNVSTTTFKVVIKGTTTAVAGSVTPAPTTPTTTATFTPTAPLVPGQSYTATLTSGIRDLAGNPITAKSWTVRTNLTVQNTSRAVKEIWDIDADTLASGAKYAASRSAGAKATFRFTGTQVTVVGRRASDGGYADVYLDGVKQTVTPISFYSSATQYGVSVWSKTGLPGAAHAVEVRALGTGPSSTATWVYLDAFKVGTVTYEEASAAVTHQFTRVTTTSASGGSYDVTGHVASGDTGAQPRIVIVFKGTGVDWYATKTAASGKATVYIDGVSRGTIDLYSSTTAYVQKVFASATLTDAVHTLDIRVTGTPHTGKTGTNVSIDKIVVR